MAELLTNVAVADAYTNQATLGPTLGITQLVFQVFNEPVYARFFKPPVDEESNRQPTLDPTEHYFPVGTLLSVDGAAGVQFRNAIGGQPATINAQIGFAGDPIFDFQSSGLFSAAVLTLSFLHNNALVGAENALDFEDSAQIQWSVVDTPGTKEAVSASFVAGSVVTSVFGRTGAVVAVSGDYTAAQVTNAADKASASQQLFTGDVGTGAGSNAVGGGAGANLHNTGTIQSSVSGAGRCFAATEVGDTVSFRWQVLGDGSTLWGLGAGAASDVTLSHPSSGVLNISTGSVFSIGAITNSSLANQGALLTSGGGVQQIGAAAGTNLTAMGVAADTNYRLIVNASGTHTWGPGNAAGDVVLSRAITNPTPAHLNLSTSLAVVGSTYETLVNVTPTPTTSVTPDYNAETSYIISIGGTGGGTLTINNASNPPSAAQTGWLYMQISNPPGNTATALTFGGAYTFTAVGGAPTTVAQAGFWRLLFVWTGAAWLCLIKINL